MKWLVTLLGVFLLVGAASAITYTYNPEYPLYQNTSAVNATSWYSASYAPWLATNASNPLTGAPDGNSWSAGSGINSSTRFSIDLGAPKAITRVYYENYHVIGTTTNYGVKDFTFWGSNSSESYLTSTYANDTGWVQKTTNVSALVQHAASDASDPQYINVTNTVPYRYYAFKFANNYGYPTGFGLRRLVLQREVAWTYSTPGTYYWVCPVNVTSITLNLGGGGGSGRGAHSAAGVYYIGYGGSAGEWSTHATIPVTAGTNYTIVVGPGGVASAVETASNAGGSSSAFSYTSVGGNGGLSLPQVTNSNGGNGANGFLLGGNAAAGGSVTGYTGGLAGTGYSAGGGGGAAYYVLPYPEGGAGGKGSDGFVGIYQSGYSTTNVPDFSGTPTTGLAGTLVSFTDASTLVDNTNLTYLWDFGDGSTSSTIGNVVHVYPYTGSYTVKLTITSDGGPATEEKEAYINLVGQSPVQPILPVQPKPVKFQIVDAYGVSLVGANVTVNYINSTLPSTSTSWLISAFGVNATVAGEMVNGSLAMQGMTGSDGSLSFIMYPVLQYQLTITNATAGLSKIVTVYPQDNEYVIYCRLTSQIPPVSRQTQLVNSTIYVTEPNASFVMFNVQYQDTSNFTTSLTWNVTCVTNMTVMYSKNFGDPDTNVKIDNYTVPTEPRGTEYSARYFATRTI